MENVVGYLILAGLALLGWLLVKIDIGKVGAQWHGRSRCAFCGKGLRGLKGQDAYADACHHCGRIQPWAEG